MYKHIPNYITFDDVNVCQFAKNDSKNFIKHPKAYYYRMYTYGLW